MKAVQALKEQWESFLATTPGIDVQEFNGSTLPPKLVQPYAQWRRKGEATLPGEAFSEPAVTVFPPRLHCALLTTAYFSTALAHLRNPDAWAAAVITHAMHRNPERNVLTFGHLHAAALECVNIALPGQAQLPTRNSAVVVAVRALNHAHLLLLWGEDTPIARAAERAGVYAPAIAPWRRAEFDAWCRGEESNE